MKIVIKKVGPRVAVPDHRVVVFCERCGTFDGTFVRESQRTTLGKKLWYTVCADRVGCRERVVAQRPTGEHPIARIADLYPE